MRNLERKREYDRNKYAEKREDNPDGVREAERLRKARQRKKARDPHSKFNHVSIDTPEGARAMDQQSYINSQSA